ncbi:MAG TPA: site-2 protease family protein [Candidatus Dormibacteraeota bacterium]
MILADPTQFIVTALYLIPALVVGIVAHELAHAAVATARGDQTPRLDGRLSINPRDHLDPLGTLAVFFIHFGWGKPMRLNPYRMRRLSDPALVWLAGPLASLLVALALSIPLKLLLASRFLDPASPPFQVVLVAFYFNVLLAIVNLLPVPTLDGYNLLAALFRRRFSKLFNRVDANRQIILVVVVLLIFFIPGLFDYVYDPVSRLLLGDVIRPAQF